MIDERHYWWLKRSYINKCCSAEPIQAWWKRQPEHLDLALRHGRCTRLVSNIMLGDTFSLRGGDKVCVITGTVIHVGGEEGSYLEYEIEGMRSGNYSHQSHARFLEKGFMWLPSFQRLYDLWTDHNGLAVSNFMSRFLSWYDKEQTILGHVDEYALHFVMQDTYQMVWTGDIWIT